LTGISIQLGTEIHSQLFNRRTDHNHLALIEGGKKAMNA